MPADREVFDFHVQTVRACFSDAAMIPALLAELRRNLSSDVGDWVHYGTTRQDIVVPPFACSLLPHRTLSMRAATDAPRGPS
jgi:hypothetical protein